MVKKGLLSKSRHYIWKGRVKGDRWTASCVCTRCSLRLSLTEPEPAEVPASDLPEWADLMLEDHGFIEEEDDAQTLALLEVIVNVPTDEMLAAEKWLRATTGCPMPGHTALRVIWRQQ